MIAPSSSSLAPGCESGGLSFPPFERRSGGLIVLGCGPDWARDLEGARGFLPDAPLIAVNGAGFLARADFLVSMDLGCLAEAQAAQRRVYGISTPRHAAYPISGEQVSHLRRKGCPPPYHDGLADYFWPGTLCGATSSWAAVRIAKRMGFERIILAGVPLERGGYARFEGADYRNRESMWATETRLRAILGFQRHLRQYVAAGEGEGVRSMSGFTAEVLGRP